MTALKLFSIAANGTPIGVFKAADAHAAVLAYVQDSGYRTVEEAAAALNESVEFFRADLNVEDLQETYEYILDAIGYYAEAKAESEAESDDNVAELNIRREALVKVAQQLADGGQEVDWSDDLDAALAGSPYRDTVYQEQAMILSVVDIKDLGLLAAA